MLVNMVILCCCKVCVQIFTLFAMYISIKLVEFQEELYSANSC